MFVFGPHFLDIYFIYIYMFCIRSRLLDVDREEYRFRVDVVMCVRSIDLKYIYIIYIYNIYIYNIY
jgi:hypothetical protein